ncbi:hypothetical protein OCA97_14685 [Bacillus cereus]|nr:hypothetical protein [Bacillus cereus]
MVRKIRYRQVLRNRHSQKGRYLKEVSQQKSFWKEDKAPTPTIELVREIHKSLGTWDKFTYWFTWEDSFGRMNNEVNVDGSLIIYPKANYKHRLLMHRRWKEQERRTLEFFEREGC